MSERASCPSPACARLGAIPRRIEEIASDRSESPQASISPDFSRKFNRAELNTAGWSMFAAWPASGITTLRAPGILPAM